MAEGPRYQAAEPHLFWQRVEDNAFHLHANAEVIRQNSSPRFHFFAGVVFCSSWNVARVFLASTSLGLMRRAALSCSIASKTLPVFASAAARLVCASAELGEIRSASL